MTPSSSSSLLLCKFVYCLFVITTIAISLKSPLKSTSLYKSKSIFQLSAVIEFSKGQFEDEVLKHTLSPVIVDFMANWCGPCKLVAPIFNVVSDELPDIKFVKVDTDIHEETVEMFNIQGLPMFILFDQGKPVATHSGALNKTKLKEFIESNVVIRKNIDA